jgi:hypothetical protein
MPRRKPPKVKSTAGFWGVGDFERIPDEGHTCRLDNGRRSVGPGGSAKRADAVARHTVPYPPLRNLISRPRSRSCALSTGFL